MRLVLPVLSRLAKSDHVCRSRGFARAESSLVGRVRFMESYATYPIIKIEKRNACLFEDCSHAARTDTSTWKPLFSGFCDRFLATAGLVDWVERQLKPSVSD